ncbi:hypothetical protein SARC_08141 [Sphaeroforma arctica JP610]|uniref:GST N-terminal domain-containing protein n=1 Tax=Sphaeroforma arctica JP610 TaxID=667725 RepID=A0A0L0FRS4_9EUKA|nr:hypothetical protein SARC_08141 [Sphaeroforma arctica JP610]KNC79465.1 hypothetical protein SARC_08141 [Sphaeroforma arctica JP610]|eukprot:XP_014153367.1 hypothetical protein SARC_08141 [Sphaeroforma arctica JP610]
MPEEAVKTGKKPAPPSFLERYVLGNLMHYCNGSNEKPDKPLLVTISVSHFCERARWALDLSPLWDDYMEDSHAPGMHMPQTNRLTDFQNTSTPMMKLPGTNQLIEGSDEILKYLAETYPECGFLYPHGHEIEILEWEHLFADTIGVLDRKWAYTHLLCMADEDDQKRLTEMNGPFMAQSGGTLERVLFGMAWPVIGKQIKRQFKLSKEKEAELVQQLDEIMDKVNRALADGREYLVGDRFTAADLTFASLAYPFLAPPEMGDVSPCPTIGGKRYLEDLLQGPLKLYMERVEGWQATPAGKLALRVYRNHRFSVKGDVRAGEMVRLSRNSEW